MDLQILYSSHYVFVAQKVQSSVSQYYTERDHRSVSDTFNSLFAPFQKTKVIWKTTQDLSKILKPVVWFLENPRFCYMNYITC